jgi:gamma-glutamyl hercynylcysteine S-oxide synthase
LELELRQCSREQLAGALRAVRARTLALFNQLTPRQLALPYSPIVNLPLWEVGHVAWFQEYWCLRQAERSVDFRPVSDSILESADGFYDSNRVGHQRRWELTLPTVSRTLDYLGRTLEASLLKLSQLPDTDEALYFHRLSLFHEYMHVEALIYTFQTMGYPLEAADCHLNQSSSQASMRSFESTTLLLGSKAGSGFIFDNEKYEHRQNLGSFAIASQVVTVGEFADFVESIDGPLPLHWRQGPHGLEQHRFGLWRPLPRQEAMVHVSAYEAKAYCLWAGKRLPTEPEWQYAAEHWPDFRWGGQVWEWTSTVFEPFPGFCADPYKEYSEPWFGDHSVVRGGSFATDPGMMSTKFRNFYQPHRNDPFIGFRVCSG